MILLKEAIVRKTGVLTAESKTNKLKAAYNNYCSRLFHDSFGGSKRQFWKYIKVKPVKMMLESPL